MIRRLLAAWVEQRPDPGVPVAEGGSLWQRLRVFVGVRWRW